MTAFTKIELCINEHFRTVSNRFYQELIVFITICFHGHICQQETIKTNMAACNWHEDWTKAIALPSL